MAGRRVAMPSTTTKLFVRPFFSGRDFHSTHHENGAFRFEPEQEGERRVWRPYDGLPAIVTFSNGAYKHEPAWYRNFLYSEEAGARSGRDRRLRRARHFRI